MSAGERWTAAQWADRARAGGDAAAALFAGFTAYEEGRSLDDNPFAPSNPGSAPLFDRWADGWVYARRSRAASASTSPTLPFGEGAR